MKQLNVFCEGQTEQGFCAQVLQPHLFPSGDGIVHTLAVGEKSERSATTESGAASGQRMPFPDYVSAQGPVPIPWTQVDPVCFLSTPSSRTG